jgi:hypothetical protein
MAMVAAVEERIWSVDKNQPISAIKPSTRELMKRTPHPDRRACCWVFSASSDL